MRLCPTLWRVCHRFYCCNVSSSSYLIECRNQNPYAELCETLEKLPSIAPDSLKRQQEEETNNKTVVHTKAERRINFNPFLLNKNRLREVVVERISCYDETRRKRFHDRDVEKLRLYLQTVVHRGGFEIENAHKILKSLNVTKFGQRICDTEIFNLLLEGVARHAMHQDEINIEYMSDFILRVRDRTDYSPTVNTLASLLLCARAIGNAGYSDEKNHLIDDVLEYHQSLLKGLFQDFYRPRSELESFKSLIRERRPQLQFDPRQSLAPVQYDSDLLSRLNAPMSIDAQFPYSGLFTKEQLLRSLDTQLEMEKCVQIKIKHLNTNLSSTIPRSRRIVEESEGLLEQWRKELGEGYDATLKKHLHHMFVPKGKNAETMSFLDFLDKSEIVELLLEHLCRIIECGDRTYHQFLCVEIGDQIVEKSHARIRSDKGYENAFREICERYYDMFLDAKKFRSSKGNHSQCWRESGLDTLAIDPNNIYREFPDHSAYYHLGQILVDEVLVKCPTFRDKRVLSVESEISKRKKKRGAPTQMQQTVIQPLPMLERNFYRDYVDMDVTELPMVVPPVPWTSSHRGGYHLHQPRLVREIPTWGPWMRAPVPSKTEPQMQPVFDCLNTLSSTPWKVNQQVLAVAENIFKKAHNPEHDLNTCERWFDSVDIPRPGYLLRKVRRPSWRRAMDGDQSAREQFGAYMRYMKKKNEMSSLWHTVHYKLSIARHFEGKVIFFPHNMDFRGRVYPLSTLFHHMGDDMVRSLFLFAKGKCLGKEGLDWLKIHCINLTGLMKRESIAERLRFANQILNSHIIKCATELETLTPGGEHWWMESDEPWQTLACCIELRDAHKLPDPTQFLSHLPIHQDGSCNGLQHYSALGRDMDGGREVNLVPSSVPGDVYLKIAKKVDTYREEDARKPNSKAKPLYKTKPQSKANKKVPGQPDFELQPEKPLFTDKMIARILEGHVNRKVVKQPVMTFVYGVTPYGARGQIRRRLKEMDTGFTPQQVGAAAKYLADKVFKALSDEFPVTVKIQNWLLRAGMAVACKYGETVSWTTPIGMPASQPYWKRYKSKEDADCAYEWPYEIKQLNAFPPNFIHSLDSTHMMMTSLHLHHEGVTYAAVHDCYWTHATDVDVMNRILREQFIALHKEPILENLRSEFVAKLPQLEKELAPLPKRGLLDIDQVLQSEFFFS